MLKPRSGSHHYKIRILILILLSHDVYALRPWDQNYEQNNGDIEAIQNNNEHLRPISVDKQITEKEVYIAGSDNKLYNLISEMSHHILCVHEIKVHFYFYRNEKFSYIRSINSSLSVLKHLLSKYPHYFYKKLENESSYNYLNNLIIIPEDDASIYDNFSDAWLNQYHNEQDMSGIDRDIKNHKDYYDYDIPNDKHYIGKDINVYVDNIISSGFNTNNNNSIYNTPARGDDSYYEFGEPDGQNFKGKDINVNVFQPYSGNIQTLSSNELQDNIYDKNDSQEENELNISSDKNYKGKNVLEEQQSRNDLLSGAIDNNNVKKENLKVPYDGVFNPDEQVYEFNYPNDNYKVKNENVNVLVSGNDEEQSRNNANDNNNVSKENLKVPHGGVYNQDEQDYKFNFPNNNYKVKNKNVNVLVSGKEELKSHNGLISDSNDNNNVSKEILKVPYDDENYQDERSYEFNFPYNNYKDKNKNVNVLVSGNESERASRNDLKSDGNDKNNVSEENLVVPYDGVYNQDKRSYEFNFPNNNYKGKNENVNVLVSGNEEEQSRNEIISGANDNNNSSKKNLEVPIDVLYNQDEQDYEFNYLNNKNKGKDINVDLNAAADHKDKSSTLALTNASYLRGSEKQFHQDDEDVANAMEPLESGGSSWADTDNNSAEEIINISKDIIPQYNTRRNTETKNDPENLQDQYQYFDKVIMDNANSPSASTIGDQEADLVDSLNTKGILEYSSEKYRSMNNIGLVEDVLPQVIPQIQETVHKPCGQQEDILQPNKYVIDQSINSIHTSVDRVKEPIEKATGRSMEDIIPCFTASEILSMRPKTHSEKSLQPKSNDIPSSHKFKSIPRKYIHRKSFQPKEEFHLYNPVDDVCEIDTSYPSANPSANANVITVPYDFTNEENNSGVPSNVFPSIKSYKPFYSSKKPYNNIFLTRPRYYKPNTSTQEYTNLPQEAIFGPQYTYKPLMTGFNTYQPHIHFQPTWPSFGKTNDSPFTTIFKKHSNTFKDIKPSSMSHDMRTYPNYMNKNLKHNQNNPSQIFKLKTVPQRKLYNYDIEQTQNSYKHVSKSPTLKLIKDKEYELDSIKYSQPTFSYPVQLTRTNCIPKIYSKVNPMSLNKHQATILAKNNIKTETNPCSCSYYIPILDQISQNPTSTYADLDTKGFHFIQPCRNKNIYTEQDPIHVASQPIYKIPATSRSVHKNLINGIYEARPNDGSIYTKTISKSKNNGQYTQSPSQIVCNAESTQNLDKKHQHSNEYPQAHYHMGRSGSSQNILRYPQPMAYKKSQWPKHEYTNPQIQYEKHATVAPSINLCQSLNTNTPGTFHKIPKPSPSKYDNVFHWSQQKPNQNVIPYKNAYSQKQYKFNKYPNYVQTQTSPWLENQPLKFHSTETPGCSTAYGYTYNGQPPITQHDSIYTVTNHEHKPYKSTQNICQPHHKSSSSNHPPLYQYPSYYLKNNYNPVLESFPTDATPNIEPTSSYKTKSYHNSIESRVPYKNYVIPCISSEKDTSSEMQHLLGSVPRNPFTNVNPLVWYGKAIPIYNKQFISGTEYPESNTYNLYKKGNSKNSAGNFNNQNYIPKLNADNTFYNQSPSLGHGFSWPTQGYKYITNRIPTTHVHTSQIRPILTPSYSTTSKPSSFTTPQNPQSFDVSQDSYDQGTIQIKTPSSHNLDKPCQRIPPTLNYEYTRPNNFVNEPCNYNSQILFETSQYSPFETPQSSSKFTQYPAFIYPQQLGSPYMSDTFVKYNQKSPCFTKIYTLNNQPDNDRQLTQSPFFKPCIFSDDKLNNINFNVPKLQTFQYIPKNLDAYLNKYKTQKSNIMTGPSIEPYSFGYGDPSHKTSTHDVTLAPNINTLRPTISQRSYKSYNQNAYNTKDSLNYFPLRFKTETKMLNRPSIPCLNYQSPNRYISTWPSIADFNSENYSASPNIYYKPCVAINSNPTMSSTLPPALSVSSHQDFNRGKNQPNGEAFSKYININKDTSEAINSIHSFIPTNAPNRLNPQRHSTKSQDPYKKTNFMKSNTANAKSIIHNPGNVDYNSSPFISQLYPETNLHATVKPYAQPYTNQKSINTNVFDTSSDNQPTLRQPKYYGPENINYINHHSPLKNNKPYLSNNKINDPLTSINYSPQYNQLNDQTPERAINNIKDVYKNKIDEEIPKLLPLQYFDDNFNDPKSNISEKLSVDLGRLTVARYDDNNRYLIKTNNPLVNLLVWKSKIKTLNGNLVIQVKDYPTMNFLPILKGPVCIDEANRLAKDIVTKMYGDPLVLKGTHSVNEPYAVILNGDCKRNVLWPAQFRC